MKTDQRMMQLLPASVIEREAKADQRNERINRIMDRCVSGSEFSGCKSRLAGATPCDDAGADPSRAHQHRTIVEVLRARFEKPEATDNTGYRFRFAKNNRPNLIAP